MGLRNALIGPEGETLPAAATALWVTSTLSSPEDLYFNYVYMCVYVGLGAVYIHEGTHRSQKRV